MPKYKLTYEDMNYFKKRPSTGRHPHMGREGTVLQEEKDTDDKRLVGGVLWKGCIGLHSDSLVDNYQRELYTTVHHMEEGRVEEELRVLGYKHNCVTVLSPEQNFGIVVMPLEGESVTVLKGLASPFTDHLDRTYYVVWKRRSGIYAVLPDQIQRDLLVEGMGLSLSERSGKTRVHANFFMDQGVIYPFVNRSVWERELCAKDGKQKHNSVLKRVSDATSLYFSQRHQKLHGPDQKSHGSTVGGFFRTRVQTTLTSAFAHCQPHSSRATSDQDSSSSSNIEEERDQEQEKKKTSIMAEEEVWEGTTFTHSPTEDEENMWYNDDSIWFKRNEDGSFEKRHELYDDDDEEEEEDKVETWEGTTYTHGPTEEEDNMWYTDDGIWFKRKKDGSFEKRWEFYGGKPQEEEEEDEEAVVKMIEGLEREMDEDFDPDASASVSVSDMEVDDDVAQAEDDANPSEEASSSEDEETQVMADLGDAQADEECYDAFDKNRRKGLTPEEEEELRAEEESFVVSDTEALMEVKKKKKEQERKDKKKEQERQKKKKEQAKAKAKTVKKKKKKNEVSSESDSGPFTESSGGTSSDDGSSSDGEPPEVFEMADTSLESGKERSAARRRAIKENAAAKKKSLAIERKRVKELEDEVRQHQAAAKKQADETKAANKKKRASAAQKKKSAINEEKRKFYLRLQGMDLKQAAESQATFAKETQRVSVMVDKLPEKQKRDLAYSVLGTSHPEVIFAIRTLLEDFADFGPQIPYSTSTLKKGTLTEERRIRLQVALSFMGGSRLGGDCTTSPVPKKYKNWKLDPNAVPDFVRDRFISPDDGGDDDSEAV